METANSKSSTKSKCSRCSLCSLPLWAKILFWILIGAIIAYGVLLASGIVSYKNPTTITTTTGEAISSWEISDLPSNEPLSMNAQEAIQAYLATTNKNIQEDQIVISGNTITVDYIGRLNENEVFDTSVKSVAEAAGIANPQRDYDEGLSFTVGAGEMIPGFDAAVVGMKVGETKTVALAPEEAYGPAEIQIPATKAELVEIWGTWEIAVNAEKVFPNGQSLKIIEVDWDNLIVSMPNPAPFAGQELIFDITLKSITPSAE